MNIIVLLFLVARSAFATDVSTKHSKETLPFDIYDRINDFADVKTSARFRSAKKYLYRSLKLHPDVLFHWFGKCGPFFNGVNCGQSAIKKFYSKYKNVMDPNDNFGNNNISKEDFIGMLIKRREFTPFNCYIYNAESKLRAIHPLEYSFKLVVPFLEDDNEKVDLLSTLQIHNNINESSRLSCFKIVFHSILDPQKRETFQYAEEMKPNKVNFEKRKKMRELLDNY
ncbi:hypothetical protein ROZALSC1DRAFT_20560 [Rozella allomycis CSF55]|uniref:F-box domain-containing protein n=1 Tax=Rozella allomycis (strain CSF55) TaxID=988480 RepID=A0A4P9YNW0_ROZAC|nr:hypothetical protein ROZALSC1DRAFT_20560 [Rozella allomycis CSF55]